MPVVDVDGLSFTYASGASPAVRDLSFRIDGGEIFGFLGPSGAGKSTTQKVLIGLLRGYRGAVSVLGRDLAAWGSDYYEQIGVSFELPNHYLRLTGVENLAYFRALYRGGTRRPEALLEMVGLADDGARLVSEYSKGMKTRLGVARALLNDPQLIFMDEPTVGLDPASGRRIKDLVGGLKAAGRTVFLTTHDMTVADELCDRVAFIVNGEIRLVDSPHDLRLAHGARTIVMEYELDGSPGRREFPLDGLGSDTDFLALLRDATVHTLHTQEATLEDVFLRVTGHSLQ
ncbi:MAG: ABC transporter ATP-binding protein [Acidobacteria bacterium]|nr:ABC transporter ATP-binding protein [Acidobacteriota bacterium]